MASEMPDVRSIKKAVTPGRFRTFGHQDFTWARESARDLHKDILNTCFPNLI